MRNTATADPPAFLDELPLSAFQFWSIIMTAATVILDGLDNQMLGLAAPSLIREWHVARHTLGSIFALGFVGMAFGTLISGTIGDRFGRRLALLLGVGTFGLATILTGVAHTLVELAALKILAGVGLGGVPGTASAMIAEFSPRRWRSVAVTFGVVCVSIGGILGGFLAAFILPTYGWRALFVVGGIATILLTVVLTVLLPESIGFLMTRPEKAEQVRGMFARMGHVPPAAVRLPTIPTMKVSPQAPIADLFRGGLLRSTVALCFAMLSGMFLIYLMFNWIPTLLSTLGFGPGVASLGLTSFNLGGTVGALIASMVIIRVGSRPTLIIMSASALVICLVLATMAIDHGHNTSGLLFALVGLGVFGSAAQSAMFAVGAHAFPTALRGRGMGVMGAAGRLGAILSALLGARLIGGGNLMFFGALAALMAVNLLSFASIRNHIPRVAATPARTGVAYERG